MKEGHRRLLALWSQQSSRGAGGGLSIYSGHKLTLFRQEPAGIYAPWRKPISPRAASQITQDSFRMPDLIAFSRIGPFAYRMPVRLS